MKLGPSPITGAVAPAGCGGGGGAPTINLAFREPADPTFLDGVDAFLFSVEDARGQPLVLRRFGPQVPLRLTDVPFGAQLTVSLDGLFGPAPLVGGRPCPVAVLAGAPPPRVSMFLASLGTFNPTTPPSGAPRSSPLAIARQDGRVLLGGGTTTDGVVATAQQYDARTGLWAMAPPLPIARSGAAVAVLPGGTLVVGGVGADGAPVAEVDRYDDITGMHPVTSTPALALTDTAVVALPDGTALIAGGASAGGGPVGTAWLYAGTTVVPVAAEMVTPRSAHTLSAVGTGNFAAVFAIGGAGADGAPLGSIELYDPRTSATAAFTLKTATLHTPRVAHTATVLETGEILIAGGRGPNGELPLEAELFDPITNTVQAAGTLAEGRVGHTATLLGDGRILVTGGIGIAGSPLATAEIYDPSFRNFAAARPLDVKRARHAALPLCDGTVLVVGGGDGAELYNPRR